METIDKNLIEKVEIKYNIDSIKILTDFYNGIFVENFPDENERDSLENIIKYIKVNEFNSLLSRIIIYKYNNEIIGGIIFDYFQEISSIAVEFIVTSKKYSGQGIGTFILNNIVNLLKNKYKKNIEWLFIEIEDPQKIKIDNLSYLYFWKKLHMKIIDFNYIQPALSSEKTPVEHLLLCVKNLKLDVFSISKEIVKKFIFLYAKHAILIENPLSDFSVKKMFHLIENLEDNTLSLKNLNF